MNKKITEKVRRYLKKHWFRDKTELRKAREVLKRYFPEDYDFFLQFMMVDIKTDYDITANDLKEFIINETNI